MLRPGQIVFTYFHLAADRQLDRRLLASGCIAVAYETLRDEHGRLPLLTPMSEVAGRMSIQQGAKYLERPQMGRGILLGRRAGRRAGPHHDPRRRRGRGQRGQDRRRLPRQHRACWTSTWTGSATSTTSCRPNVTVLFSDRHTIREQFRHADLVIGAVLVPGAKAPVLIERGRPAADEARAPCIIDVAIDQGGCTATSRPTTHSDPDLRGQRRGPLLRGEHAGGGRPHQHLRLVQRDASLGAADRQCAACRRPPSVRAPLSRAINVFQGEITNRAVAETFGMPYNARFERD